MNNNTHKDKQPGFIRKQFEFSAHIRDPKLNKKPDDIEDRRMGIYRELFYNNVEGFISSGFPILRDIFTDEAWHEMVRDFFSRHRCKTPYFLEISEEFLAYLEHERDNPDDPVFIKELAHYEWVELALNVSEDEIDERNINPEGDFRDAIPVISPLAWLLSYQFDVHHIGPEYQPTSPPEQMTTLIVYRDRNQTVGFMEINPVTAHMIQSLQLNPEQTGEQLLEKIAQELNHADPTVVINGGLQIMEQLRQADILTGTRIQ